MNLHFSQRVSAASICLSSTCLVEWTRSVFFSSSSRKKNLFSFKHFPQLLSLLSDQKPLSVAATLQFSLSNKMWPPQLAGAGHFHGQTAAPADIQPPGPSQGFPYLEPCGCKALDHSSPSELQINIFWPPVSCRGSTQSGRLAAKVSCPGRRHMTVSSQWQSR